MALVRPSHELTRRSANGTLAPMTREGALSGSPLSLLFRAYVVFWVLGFSYFGWPFLFALLLLPLWRLKLNVKIPPGLGLWLGYLAFVGLAAFHSPSSWSAYVWRLTIYLGTTAAFVYSYNLSRQGVHRVINALVFLWMITVAGGYLGVLDPHGTFSTFAEHLLPSHYTSNDFVYQSVNPSFAQLSTFLGRNVARPEAPFPYTDTWGAVYGMLLPIVFLRTRTATVRMRRVIVLFAVASVVPLVLCLDRGLWLSLGTALVVVGVWGRARVSRYTKVSVLSCFVVVVILIATPLGSTVIDRLHHGQSDSARTALFGETMSAVARSPIVGYGTPQSSHLYSRAQAGASQPAIGTQGTIWLVMISAGLPGLLFFVGWIALSLARLGSSRSRVPRAVCVLIVIFAVQSLFYDQLPVALLIAAACIGMGLASVAYPEEEDADEDVAVGGPGH